MLNRNLVSWSVYACFGLFAGLWAASCALPSYPPVAFRCDPSQPKNCPETHICCSTDPAAVGGALPDFAHIESPNTATPYFAGINNAFGTQGMCIEDGFVAAGAGLLEAGVGGCPVPCNPTWTEAEIDVVCGAGRECCQTTPLEPEDCVFVDGEWRPATGRDINKENNEGVVLTRWNQGEHQTHQDPNGAGCRKVTGQSEGAAFTDCVEQLTVADQRGFCIAVSAGSSCVTAATNTTSACLQLNNSGA